MSSDVKLYYTNDSIPVNTTVAIDNSSILYSASFPEQPIVTVYSAGFPGNQAPKTSDNSTIFYTPLTQDLMEKIIKDIMEKLFQEQREAISQIVKEEVKKEFKEIKKNNRKCRCSCSS